MTPLAAFKIWIDNDACPRRVREIIFKAAKRRNIMIMLVANSYSHPPSDQPVQVICADSKFDSADNEIADQVAAVDLVITSDVPLAAKVIAKGATALSAQGRLFDRESIGEQLTMRNLRQELRSSGELFGGPRPLNDQDISKFSNALDRILTQKMRQYPAPAQVSE